MAAVLCVLIVTLGAIFSGALKTGPGATTTVQQGQSLSMVSVSASGTVKGIPSMAMVDVFVNATGKSTSAATANLSSKLVAFNKTVSNYIGGNTSLVKTQYYNVGQTCSGGPMMMPVYYGQACNSTENVIYQAQESITVTLPKIAQLNDFLSNITGVSGLQVQDVSAELSDAQVTQLRQQALQGAIANATTQAKQIIGNATIVNTSVSVGSYYAYPYPIYAASNGGPAIQKTPLYYNGTSSVYENIQATFYYRK
jgi:uncharacterized protein YggE